MEVEDARTWREFRREVERVGLVVQSSQRPASLTFFFLVSVFDKAC